MAGEIKRNMHLINAPAGSGKTTYIRMYLKKLCLSSPNDKILCITYTKRAAQELKKDLDNTNVTVSTIHAYINDLISPFFAHPEAIDLYWEIFSERINERIKNTVDEHIVLGNQQYIEKYGCLSETVIRENLKKLAYGETPFTSLYYGKLSHDDLIMFANRLIKKYPILLRKIGDKYNYIFIDEYQDTSAYILDLFYDAVKGSRGVELYLFGDKMQQIYRNYDGSFEEKLKEFDASQRLVINYRSAKSIIDILNNLYNDDTFKQETFVDNLEVLPDINPTVVFSSNLKDTVTSTQDAFPGILTLYLMNREKYAEIGAGRLYEAFSNMEAYSFGRKNSATDVLSDLTSDNPDTLMCFLFLVCRVMRLYSEENYGSLISTCKKEQRYFNTTHFKVSRHTDKKQLKGKFEEARSVYEKEGSKIKDLIVCLTENGLIQSALQNSFEENPEYQTVLDVEITEVRNLANYLDTPYISTQHGVKGESHPSVIFVAADNSINPNVRMYSFFELWSKIDFLFPSLNNSFTHT